jgi:hypothetical protein
MNVVNAITLQTLHRPIGRLPPLCTHGEARTVLIGEILQGVHYLRVFEGFVFDAADHRKIATITAILRTQRETNGSYGEHAEKQVSHSGIIRLRPALKSKLIFGAESV